MKRYIVPTVMALVFCAAVIAQSYRVGPIATPDGQVPTIRFDRYGSAATQASGAVNKERVRRGQCYYAAAQGAGVAPGTTLSTTAMLVVYNPANSGVLVVVNKAYAPYFSGTLGTGTLYHCLNGTATQTAPSGGTLLANTPALGGSNNASVAAVRTGATVVAPVIVAPMAYLAPELATSVTSPQQTFELLEDAIQLLPGTTYQLQAVAAAGTSPLLAPAVFWEEVPLLNGQP